VPNLDKRPVDLGGRLLGPNDPVHVMVIGGNATHLRHWADERRR
jgi:hypothetical protein